MHFILRFICKPARLACTELGRHCQWLLQELCVSCSFLDSCLLSQKRALLAPWAHLAGHSQQPAVHQAQLLLQQRSNLPHLPISNAYQHASIGEPHQPCECRVCATAPAHGASAGHAAFMQPPSPQGYHTFLRCAAESVGRTSSTRPLRPSRCTTRSDCQPCSRREGRVKSLCDLLSACATAWWHACGAQASHACSILCCTRLEADALHQGLVIGGMQPLIARSARRVGHAAHLACCARKVGLRRPCIAPQPLRTTFGSRTTHWPHVPGQQIAAFGPQSHTCPRSRCSCTRGRF